MKENKTCHPYRLGFITHPFLSKAWAAITANIFKSKKPTFIIKPREGRAPAFIPINVHNLFENQKLKPTPYDSKLGMCTDDKCPERYKEKFLTSLMDLDSMSCFMKAHHIETFSDISTPEEITAWGDQTDYAAYIAGEINL